MKSKFISKALLASSFILPVFSIAQTEPQTVSTDPVGAMTIEIAGNGGSGSKFTAVGFPLINSAEFVGVLASVSSSSGQTVLEVSNGDWGANDINNPGGFAQYNWENAPLYHVIIKSGDHEGLILDIMETGNSTLVVEELSSLNPGLSGDESIEIRMANTLASLFGVDNSAGFNTGQNSEEADNIYILNNQGQFIQYYYQIDQLGGFGGGDGWRRIGNSDTDVSSTIIPPEEGIIVARMSPEPLSVVIAGDVKIGNSESGLFPGFNMLSYQYPLDTTLGESGLWNDGLNGIQAGQDSTSADIVYLLDNEGQFEMYYYQLDQLGGFGGGDGWRKAGDSDTSQDDKLLAAGQAIIVLKRSVQSRWAMVQPF